MTHDTRRTTDNAWGISQVPHRGDKKSELDLTIIASILGVGVLYLKFGTLQENKVWYLTASENHWQKFLSVSVTRTAFLVHHT